MTWHVDRDYPIHVYDELDCPVATFHTAADARAAVKAFNAAAARNTEAAQRHTEQNP